MDMLVSLFLLLGIVAFLVIIWRAIPMPIRDGLFGFAAALFISSGNGMDSQTRVWICIGVGVALGAFSVVVRQRAPTP